jgi:hypothetical protein
MQVRQVPFLHELGQASPAASAAINKGKVAGAAKLVDASVSMNVRVIGKTSGRIKARFYQR